MESYITVIKIELDRLSFSDDEKRLKIFEALDIYYQRLREVAVSPEYCKMSMKNEKTNQTLEIWRKFKRHGPSGRLVYDDLYHEKRREHNAKVKQKKADELKKAQATTES